MNGDGSMTLGDIVIDNARRFPDVVAYRLGDRDVTHGQLHERALRLISAMAACRCATGGVTPATSADSTSAACFTWSTARRT